MSEDKKTVPYLYYSYSDSHFPPGTLVMASRIHDASDEELLRLGRRSMVSKRYWNDKKFLESVRSACSKYGYEWIVASGETIIFIDSQRMRIHYKMCEHSMRISLWRRQNEW